MTAALSGPQHRGSCSSAGRARSVAFRPHLEQKYYLLSIAFGTLLAFSFSAFWALTLPYFDGPDEGVHFNSVVRLVAGGGWPDAYDAPRLGQNQQALYEYGYGFADREALAEPTPAAERSTLLAPTTFPDRYVDNMVQHPPGYYLVAASILRIVNGSQLRWDLAMVIVRLTSAAILAVTVPFTIGIVRWTTGQRLNGLLAGSGILCIPFLWVLGGYVSNDVLLITACTATFYFLIRALRDPDHHWWITPSAGIALGIALATKGFALMLIPSFLLMISASAWRGNTGRWKALASILGPSLIAFCIGGWWWVRNLRVYGKLQPSMYGSRKHRTTAPEGYDLPEFLLRNVRRLNATFWGRGGREEVAFPEFVVTAAGISLVLTLLVALLISKTRKILLLASIQPLLILVTIFRNSYSIYWDTGDPVRGIQGRYLFAGIAAFGIAIGASWLLILRIRSRAFRTFIAMLGSLLPLATFILSALWIVPRTWARFWAYIDATPLSVASSMGLPSYVYFFIAAIAVITAFGCTVIAGWFASRQLGSGEHSQPRRSGRAPSE